MGFLHKMVIIILVLVLAFPVCGLIYAYRHRNDPLTWEEAYDQLKENDCCACEMCVNAHMKWGKR